MKKKTIAILGSTGSIGLSALQVIKKSKEFKVDLLMMNKNYQKIINQIKVFKPNLIVISNKKTYLKIKKKYQYKKIIILNDIHNVKKYSRKFDVTISAIPGIAGLEPTIEFTKISKKILLANKEAIICGWHLIKKNSAKHKTEVVPIDSEHFSINMLLKNYSNTDIEKIYITASGGPFLNLKLTKFKNITPKIAINHPKWKMGKKISIDSATMMNKVLEITEAVRLFPFNLEKFKILIHPDSLVHAIVKLKNGTSIYLYHSPDMKIPIANALFKNFNYKKFFNKPNNFYNKVQNLHFSNVDKNRFPSVNLIPEMNSRKSSAIIINAANEIFVDQFLKNNIKFNAIVSNLKLVLRDKQYIKTSNLSPDSVKNIYTIDSWARKILRKKNKYMLKIFTVLFYLVFLNLHSEIVQKLQINGNDRISDETIKVYGEIEIGKDLSATDINRILKNLFDTNFFDDVKISVSNNVLNINVKEYAVINSISLEGEKSNEIKEKILEKLNLKEKESFIENKLSQDISLLKKIYASIGFNFVNVEAKIEKFNDNRVNLIYFLEKGKKTNISQINFIGDKKIKDKRLRDIIVSEEKKFWKFLSRNTYLNNNNIELDKRLLLNYYKSLGYYDVQVLSSNAEVSKNNETKLTYTINAGTRYRVTKISTNVSEVFDSKLFTPLKKDFNKIIGKYYSPFSVKKLLDELDLLIASNDLQFVEHSVNEILESDTIEIKINIFEGPKQLVEKINIKGNTVTDESVIRGELRLDEGDPVNNLKIDQSIARLKSRNLFGYVKNKIIDGSNKDLKIIEIEVEERPTGEISAGAGIGTNGGSAAFNVTESNWLGKGVNISTNFDISAEAFTGELSVTLLCFKYY